MNADFNILVHKIDSFRRKYILYQLVRGILLVFLLFIVFYVILNFLEYSFYMSSAWRRNLFLTFLLFFGLVTLRFILFPGMQLLGLIKVLNNKKVTSIIRNYIPGIKDKLLNIIELNEIQSSPYSADLTDAAISQKIKELRFIDFSEAISLKNLRTLLGYLAISFLVITTIYFIDRSIITEPGNRIIHYNQTFVRPAPYAFVLKNSRLSVKKGENFVIQTECQGKEVPSVIYINIGGNNFVMKPVGESLFEYEMTAIVRSVDFYFTDLKFNSGNYTLEVIPVPVINQFTVEVIPPSYTGLSGIQHENIGDIQVVKGSQVTWNFECFDTDSLMLRIKEGAELQGSKENGGQFRVASRLLSPGSYDVMVKNDKTSFETVMGFSIHITEDLYPEIKVVQLPDSSMMTRFYFRGSIHDDYGFTQLRFHVNIEEKDSSFTLPVVPSMTTQEFYYTVDFKDFSSLGKTISYYFSVTDNDQVNLPKTTSSGSFVFTFPDRKELNEKQKSEFDSIEKMLKESQEIAAELKMDIRELQLKNMNNTITDWEKSQLVEEILSKKSDLENVLEQIEKMNQQSNQYQNTFQEQSGDILKKQEQVQDLLEKVMTDELKKLLEEFSKLAEEFNSKQLNEISKQMELSFDDLSKQLDRNLEMLRKMKIEQELQEIVKRVEELQKKEEQGSRDILENKDFGKQEETEKERMTELQDIRQELQGILDENNEMEKPLLFDDFKEEFEEIK